MTKLKQKLSKNDRTSCGTTPRKVLLGVAVVVVLACACRALCSRFGARMCERCGQRPCCCGSGASASGAES